MLEYILHRVGYRSVVPKDTPIDLEEIGKLSWGVIIADMQPDFTVKIKNLPVLVSNQLKVLEFCEANDIPVALLEYNDHRDTLPELKEAVRRVPRHDSFIKLDYSGFSNPRLDKYLRSQSVNALLFMGLNACVCILETADDAINAGYRIATSYKLMSCACRGIPSPVAEWYVTNGIYQSEPSKILKAIRNQKENA